MKITIFKTGRSAEQEREYLFQLLDALPLAEPETEVLPAIQNPRTSEDTEIRLIAIGSSKAVINARRSNPNAKIAVLNFASFKNPGGRFLEDSVAQEEDLCYCSNLFLELQKYQKDFYDINRTMLNSGLYADRCLLTKNVSFVASAPANYLSKGEFYAADVITCAAPNLNYMIRQGRQWDKQILQAMQDRVHYINSVLAGKQYDIVIYGAYGCGVFRNDPTFTATCFKWDLINNFPHAFKEVVFAIPGETSKNYLAFRKVIFNE